MPKEKFENGKLTIIFDEKGDEDKVRKLLQQIKKDKKQITNLRKEQLVLIVKHLISK